MRKTLGLIGLGFSLLNSCMSMDMPINPTREAERVEELSRKKENENKARKSDSSSSATIRVVQRIEFAIPFYRPLTKDEKEKDIKTIKGLEHLCSRASIKSFTDSEGEVEPIFDIFEKISGRGPEIDFDIIPDSGLDYPLLRLTGWSAIYFSPYFLIKNSKLSIANLAHEEGHRKDRFYSKWDYAFDWSRRCRMEAVAISHQHLVADYLANVYDLASSAKKIWAKTRLSEKEIRYIEKFRTFKEFYDCDHDPLDEKGLDGKSEYLIARTIYHVILCRYKGSPKQTFRFLSTHDDKAVFEAVYDVLEKKNFTDAVKSSILMAGRRMRFIHNYCASHLPVSFGMDYFNRFLKKKTKNGNEKKEIKEAKEK